jgi:hypothetical protein
MRLEKDKADMTFALQRAGTDKDHQVVAAKAAASVAEGKLQSLLEELSNAKHTSQAASTTSGLVLKVRWALCNICNTVTVTVVIQGAAAIVLWLWAQHIVRQHLMRHALFAASTAVTIRRP